MVNSMTTLARGFAEALARGHSSPDEAVAWIDAVVTAQPKPPEMLLEASLCGRDLDRLISSLRRLPETPDDEGVTRLILGHMRGTLEKRPESAARIAEQLYALAQEGRVPSVEAEAEMLRFDDGFALARRGIFGDETELRNELTDFLRRHGVLTSNCY